MNKITRKSFLKVLAATMVGGAAASALTGAAAPVSIDETNGKVSRWVKNNLNPDGPLTIAKQGMFSSGGTVTAPVAGTYDATTNWLDTTRAGNTLSLIHISQCQTYRCHSRSSLIQTDRHRQLLCRSNDKGSEEEQRQIHSCDRGSICLLYTSRCV